MNTNLVEGKTVLTPALSSEGETLADPGVVDALVKGKQ